MPCDCSCDLNDSDRPEFYSEDWHKARKPHTCCECGGTIQPGQRYHAASGKWNGTVETFHTCSPCARIRADYCPTGFAFGELDETIRECLGFGIDEIPEDDGADFAG